MYFHNVFLLLKGSSSVKVFPDASFSWTALRKVASPKPAPEITITHNPYCFKHTLPFSSRIPSSSPAWSAFSQDDIPFKDPFFHQFTKKRLIQNIFQTVSMSSGDQFTSTVDHRLHSLEILFAAQFIHSHHIWRHGTDQHLHSF